MTLRGQPSWNAARRVSATLSITLLPTLVNFRERPRANRLPSLSSRAFPLFTDASRPIDLPASFNSTPTTIRWDLSIPSILCLSEIAFFRSQRIRVSRWEIRSRENALRSLVTGFIQNYSRHVRAYFLGIVAKTTKARKAEKGDLVSIDATRKRSWLAQFSGFTWLTGVLRAIPWTTHRKYGNGH